MSPQDQLWCSIATSSLATSTDDALAELKTLLRRGADPLIYEHRDLEVERQAGTPLHYAAMFGKVPWIHALHEAGVDVMAMSQTGKTPACQAAFSGQTGVLQALRGMGVDLAAHRSTEKSLSLALIAINGRADQNLETVDFLLSAGCDPNFKTGDQRSLAHSSSSYPTLLRNLQSHGADLGALDERGMSPVRIAAEKAGPSASSDAVRERARAGFVFLALEGLDLDAPAQDGRSARFYALRSRELRDFLRSMEAQDAARLALSELGLKP